MFDEFKIVVRSLLKAPGYSLTVAATLAIGLGATVAFYSLFARTLFPNLGYADSAKLVQIQLVNRERLSMPAPVTVPRLIAYETGSTTLAGIAGCTGDSVNLIVDGEPEGIHAVRVTANYFSLLGVAPVLGRSFLPEECQPGKDTGVILTHQFWNVRFKADPTVLGRRIVVDERSCVVIGVLSPDFHPPVGMPAGQVYLPLAIPPESSAQAVLLLPVFARLQPGVTPGQAQAELRTLHPKTELKFWEKFEAVVTALGLPSEQPWYQRYALEQWTALASISFLYAIAVVNAGSLMLVRTLGRRREFGIRLALGGTHWAVVRPLLFEGLILTMAGMLGGLLVARWGMPALLALAPGGNDVWANAAALNRPALLFLTCLSLFTGLAVAVGPACRVAGMNLSDAVKEGGTAVGESARLRALRGTLVVVEATLAVALLAGAGLMVRTFYQLQQVQPGYEPAGRFAVTINMPRSLTVLASLTQAGRTAQLQQFQQVVDRLAALPGIAEAGLASSITPNATYYFPSKLHVAGRSESHGGAEIEAEGTAVSADFLTTLGVAVQAGRDFTGRRPSDAPALVINETMATTAFPGNDPVGEQLQPFANSQEKWEIIGVVTDVRSAREAAKPRFYYPYWQGHGLVSEILVRTAGAPGVNFNAMLRHAIHEVNPQFAVMAITALDQRLRDEVYQERFIMTLLTVLSALALLLAAVGLSAMMAYTVTQRRAEFAIRLTLGATSGSIYRLVIGRGLALAVGGVGLGLWLAWTLSRFLKTFLYQTNANDPLIYGLVGLVLLLVTVLACWLPARRATKVDALVVLRSE